jgi:Holliday junction resolvase RusA-like endonuclease
MTCVGRAGFHNVQPSNKRDLTKWRKTLEPAGLALRGEVGGVVTTPCGIEVTLTLERPASVTRPYPAVRNGDVDKLARAILDGLTVPKAKPHLGVLADDAIVCELVVRKWYPDSPGATDALDRPGAVIRLYPIGNDDALF